MRVTVYGPGGVGGYLAAKLAAAEVADVSVVARGRHLAAIRSSGLRLESLHGDTQVQVQATDDPGEIGPVDVVLITTKDTDIPEVAGMLPALVGEDTAVVTFQNGISSPETVADQVGEDRVLPGIAYIFSTVAAPGLIRHTAGPARYVFGSRTPEAGPSAQRVSALFSGAGVEHDVADDIDVALWSKFAVIVATAGATAPSRLPIDVLRAHATSASLFRRLAEETIDVGRACGVDLPSDAVDECLRFIDTIGPGAYSSLLYDLLHGKPMELETLHGTVVALARTHGVDVPVSETVHALLAPWAELNARPGGDRPDAVGDLMASAG